MASKSPYGRPSRSGSPIKRGRGAQATSTKPTTKLAGQKTQPRV